MFKQSSHVTPMILAGLAALVLCAPAAAREDATRLLARADAWRGGFESAVLRVKLTNYENARVTEDAEFEVYTKGDNSLVKFLSARSKGQSLLMRGDDMWIFLPSVERPVRITPIQRLLGNVSNGDLARLRYSIDYDAAVEGDAVVEGASCTVLDLRARRKGATYQRVRYFVRRDDGRPVQAEYFLTSGKAIKTATFGELRELGGRRMLTRVVIVDATRPSSRTTVDVVAITPRELPDKIFSPSRVGG